MVVVMLAAGVFISSVRENVEVGNFQFSTYVTSMNKHITPIFGSNNTCVTDQTIFDRERISHGVNCQVAQLLSQVSQETQILNQIR